MIPNFDLQIFQWLNSWALWRPWMDTLIIFRATFLGYWIVLALLLFGMISFIPVFPRARARLRKNWEMIFLALGTATVARFGIVELIRFWYDRARPFEVLSNVHQLISPGGFISKFHGGGSFPSGHAVFFFALAAIVGRYYPKTSILFYLAALNLSIARVQAGVHWPSDIIAGALVGILTSIICRAFLQKYRNAKTAA